MQADDKTPVDWSLPVESFFERAFKKPIRSLIYPLYLNIGSKILKKNISKHFRIYYMLTLISMVQEA